MLRRQQRRRQRRQRQQRQQRRRQQQQRRQQQAFVTGEVTCTPQPQRPALTRQECGRMQRCGAHIRHLCAPVPREQHVFGLEVPSGKGIEGGRRGIVWAREQAQEGAGSMPTCNCAAAPGWCTSHPTRPGPPRFAPPGDPIPPVHHVVGMQVRNSGGNVHRHLLAVPPPAQLPSRFARQRSAQVAALACRARRQWSVAEQGWCQQAAGSQDV